jgi:hypothetical protein
MITDDFLFATIIAGTGIAVDYLRAEVLSSRRFKAAELKREIVQRELHFKKDRVSRSSATAPAPKPAFSDHHEGFECDELAF